MSKFIPSHETSCLCDCGCFLISLEPSCPICGNSNPVYGNKSLEELDKARTRSLPALLSRLAYDYDPETGVLQVVDAPPQE